MWKICHGMVITHVEEEADALHQYHIQWEIRNLQLLWAVGWMLKTGINYPWKLLTVENLGILTLSETVWNLQQWKRTKRVKVSLIVESNKLSIIWQECSVKDCNYPWQLKLIICMTVKYLSSMLITIIHKILYMYQWLWQRPVVRLSWQTKTTVDKSVTLAITYQSWSRISYLWCSRI